MPLKNVHFPWRKFTQVCIKCATLKGSSFQELIVAEAWKGILLRKLLQVPLSATREIKWYIFLFNTNSVHWSSEAKYCKFQIWCQAQTNKPTFTSIFYLGKKFTFSLYMISATSEYTSPFH